MPISRPEALASSQEAVDRVIRRWGAYIPTRYHGTRAKDIFVLHLGPLTFRDVFAPIWIRTFKNAVQSTDLASTVALPGGFVTPELAPEARKIHVNLAATDYDWMGLFAHEFIHWLSHAHFFPEFYVSMPGRSNEIVEGLTDYITLKCFHGHADGLDAAAMQQYRQCCVDRGWYKLPKVERAAYNWSGQYDRARQWAKQTPGNEHAAMNFVFNGIRTHLPF